MATTHQGNSGALAQRDRRVEITQLEPRGSLVPGIVRELACLYFLQHIHMGNFFGSVQIHSLEPGPYTACIGSENISDPCLLLQQLRAWLGLHLEACDSEWAVHPQQGASWGLDWAPGTPQSLGLLTATCSGQEVLCDLWGPGRWIKEQFSNIEFCKVALKMKPLEG